MLYAELPFTEKGPREQASWLKNIIIRKLFEVSAWGKRCGLFKRLRGNEGRGKFQVQMSKDQVHCWRGLGVQAGWWKNHFLPLQTENCGWWRKHLRTISLFQVQVQKGSTPAMVDKEGDHCFCMFFISFALFTLLERLSITSVPLMSKQQMSNKGNDLKFWVASCPNIPTPISFL